jgi:hypothetical protein
MRADAGRAGNNGSGQEGMTIVLVLFFLVVATIFGAVSFRKVKGEMNETTQNVKVSKSKFVAEAAVYLGLTIVQGVPGYTCVTHKSDGSTRATGAGSCIAEDLTKIPKIYSTGVQVESSTGWLLASPADTAEALSGSLTERLRVKIWMPHADTVRVVGRATVNGIEQDVQLFGSW